MTGAATPDGKPRWRHRFLKPFGSGSRKLSLSLSTSSCTIASSSSTQDPLSTSPTLVSTTSSHQSTALPAAQPSNINPASGARQQGDNGKPSGHDLLHGALQRLSEPDRATLQLFILPTTCDVNEALGSCLAAAKQKQEDCNAKRWTFAFAGRTVTLREEADKVVHWLNRFKDVGDIAVNADPIHAGLPWAGVRLLLEVRVSITHRLYHNC